MNVSVLEASIHSISVTFQDEVKMQRSNLAEIAESVSFLESCKEIINLSRNLSSGYYYIRLSNGSSIKVYCNMKMTCDSVTGGWMRVAKLNKMELLNAFQI